MKRFMSMILMAAVVVTSVVVPNSNNIETVKAAGVTYSVRDLTVNEQKYDNYEDFLEAICVAEGYCEKVDLDAYSGNYSISNGVETRYTYRQWIAKWGCYYTVPDDCVSALYSCPNAYLAYKVDGTKVIIYNEKGYDREGYDYWGYDREGYDREGYDNKGYGRDGYNKEGYNRGNCDREGYDREGYDKWGYNREGYDKDGHSEKEKAESLAKYQVIVKYNKLCSKVTSIRLRKYNYENEYQPVKNMSLTKKNVNSKGFGEYTVTVEFKNGHVYKESHVVVPLINGGIKDNCGDVWEINTGTNLLCGTEGNKAYFLDGNGWLYKRYSGVDVVVSSKKYGEGKVYYKSSNHKLKKPSKYNPLSSSHKFGDNGKYGSNVCKIKNSKKGRYITFKFYIKINGKKYCGYTQTCKITD